MFYGSLIDISHDRNSFEYIKNFENNFVVGAEYELLYKELFFKKSLFFFRKIFIHSFFTLSHWKSIFQFLWDPKKKSRFFLFFKEIIHQVRKIEILFKNLSTSKKYESKFKWWFILNDFLFNNFAPRSQNIF